MADEPSGLGGGTFPDPGGRYAGTRSATRRAGGRKWSSGKLEFDTKGVREFTADIGKAETAVGRFVKQVDTLAKSLAKIPDDKLKALTAIGGKGAGGSGNGGDYRLPALGSTGSDPEGDKTEFAGEKGKRGRNGGDSKFMGDEDSGIAKAYFATQIATQVGGSIGQYYEQTKSRWSVMDYANQVGRIRAPGQARSFASRANWANMQGITSSEDAAALQNQMNSMLGQQLGAGQHRLTRQLSGLNLINPEFGSASAAAQHYAQSFLTPQAAWSAQGFGLKPGVVGGNMQDPNKFMESIILRASGKQSWSQLNSKDTADLFSMWGKGRANVQAMFPGVTPEMMDTLSLAASYGAKHGGLEEGWQRKGMDKTLQAEIMKGPANQLEHDAERLRESRASMRAVIKAENQLKETTNDLVSAFSDLLPYVEALGGGLAGVAGALAPLGAVGGLGTIGRAGKSLWRRATGRGGAGAAARTGGGLVDDVLAQGGRAAGGAGRGLLGRIGSKIGGPAGLGIFTVGRTAYDTSRDSGEMNLSGLGSGSDKSVFDKVSTLDRWARAANPLNLIGDIGDPGDAAKVPSNLDPGFASSLRRLFEDATFDITVSSGRRSIAEQEKLFYARHTQVAKGTPGAKEYKGKYYKHTSGPATAVPGKSKHQKGHAVDLRIDGRSANSHKGWQNWIAGNVGKYGLRHGASFGEWWHIETPGTVSEAATGGEATPTPGIGGGAGGGIGTGFSAEKRFLGGFNSSLSSILQSITGVSKFSVRGGAAGALAGETPGGSEAGTGTNGAGRPEILSALRAAGFSGESLRMAYAIGMAESSGNTSAHGDQSLANAKWGHSIGFFQIRSVNAERGKGSSRDASRLEDINFNARSAWEISGGGKNWRPWSMYTNGGYKKYLDPNIGDAVPSGTGGGNAGGGANITVGGKSISIASVSLTVKTETLSNDEAERLARMTIAKIQEEAEMAELGTS
jgi:hypothetical protein